ncbi:MAG: type IV secretory system conjugative DNA transfer family protein, partial [Gammaproteobacteria bacterium]
MDTRQIETQPQQASPISGEPASASFLPSYVTPQMLLILLVCGAGIAWSAFSGGGGTNADSGSTGKNAKARAKWAGKKEFASARKLAIKQLNGRSRKSACVWIIRPTTLEFPDEACEFKVYKSGRKQKLPPKTGAIPKESPVVVKGEKHNFYSKFDEKKVAAETIWIPDTQRSVMVVGAPGSGKTFSAIDPMLRAVVEQGYPLILYDFKYPTQTSTIAWYAEQMGYEIRVFAPGFPESDVINLLDFLTGDPQIDAALARQLANTMNK